MKIIYVPIDERPCNTHVVERIAKSNSSIELISPPAQLFGIKKKAANSEGLWEWINQNAANADALILSIDMLVYGGLLPSRIHELSDNAVSLWMNRLRTFHQTFPSLPIYSSNLIMRTPKYSSSDEEPDYYENWGREIFLQAYLKDKKTHEGLSKAEDRELGIIGKKLPQNFVDDYENRRKFNLRVNVEVLDLVSEGVINFLSIPQDDSAEYGYTAMDQQIVVKKRDKLRLYKYVQIYPGADEVGATLLARVYNDLNGVTPKVYPIWSSILGPAIIPMYEDRPFAESMKAHILAAGCQLVDNADSADLILAYNTPGKVMQEAWDQIEKDITYSSHRNILQFVDQIKMYIKKRKNVIVADSAYANGGDLELIRLLDEEEILDGLVSYKGWNTNCNTLGTTLSQGIIGRFGHTEQLQENLIYHLLDDYFYQAEIRMGLTNGFLKENSLSYFDLKDKSKLVNDKRDQLLMHRFTKEIKKSFRDIRVKGMNTNAPWNRMFECGMQLKVIKK